MSWIHELYVICFASLINHGNCLKLLIQGVGLLNLELVCFQYVYYEVFVNAQMQISYNLVFKLNATKIRQSKVRENCARFMNFM